MEGEANLWMDFTINIEVLPCIGFHIYLVKPTVGNSMISNWMDYPNGSQIFIDVIRDSLKLYLWMEYNK
jgi:hypothetical protein